MGAYDARRRLIQADAVKRVAAGTRVLQRKLKAAAPKNTGEMATKTTATQTGLSVRVRVAVPYASHTNRDTPPHEIVARGNALRFFWPKVGPPQPRFYKRVQHPGTSNVADWYGDTLDEWVTILDQVSVN